MKFISLRESLVRGSKHNKVAGWDSIQGNEHTPAQKTVSDGLKNETK